MRSNGRSRGQMRLDTPSPLTTRQNAFNHNCGPLHKEPSGMITTNKQTEATRKEVWKVELVPPNYGGREAGKVWEGIPHKELIRAFYTHAGEAGWKLLGETFAMSNDGADLIAAYDLGPYKEITKANKSVAIRHSNSGKSAMYLYLGLTLDGYDWRCGIPFFKIRVAKRQTVGLDLGAALKNAIMEAEFKFPEILDFIKEMDQMELSEQEAEHLMLKAAREKAIGWSMLGELDENLDDLNSWGLLQSFAITMSNWNVPLKQLDRIMQFGRMLPGYPVNAITEDMV